MAKLSRPSIRTYLILMNLILLFLLFPSSTLLLVKQEAKNRDIELQQDLRLIRLNLENRRATLTRNIALSAGQAIAGYDFTFLNILVDQVVKDDPEILYCIIMSKNKLALAHSDHEKIGAVLDSKNDLLVSEMLQNYFSTFSTQNKNLKNSKILKDIRFIEKTYESGSKKESIIEAVSPVYNGNELWGALRCGYSLNSIQNEIQMAKKNWNRKVEQYKIFLITIIGIFFSMGIVVAALFTRLFVTPLRVLSEGVSRIADGDLDYAISQKDLVFDEFMELSTAFNSMTGKLKDSYTKLGEYNRFLEKKVAERTLELKEAQNTLLQKAHEAGMAEMAVGILHNIGNAITPAKVGTSLLSRTFRESPIRNGFNKASSQILSAIQNSPIEDKHEKQRLSQIVKLLPESIMEEYKYALLEIKKIQDTHEHIESIIHLQMQYGLSDELDQISINDVIEDALKMLKEFIEKYRIKLQKNLTEIPHVRIQKAMLLQIFVNLIKNSIESMENVSENHRTLIISTSCDTEPSGTISISIQDSGVGFSEEEKQKLFTFGYTTKKRGSGYGLHSCANNLIASNGSISAFSEGKGKGAKFIVRMPKNNVD